MPLSIELRIFFCVRQEENVHNIITLLEALKASECSTIRAYVVHLIEIICPAAPILSSYNGKGMKTKTNSTDEIMKALTKYTKNSHHELAIHPYAMIASNKSMKPKHLQASSRPIYPSHYHPLPSNRRSS
ncbi:hypothetical protein Patl1_06690 [Pistacia atlantica]|uniref:Uncharacterized protein n=1 Tax=Pistacia atlantica TaxID=434234 RepID=A0ACC1BRC2_9ROSI|nr:hypothetical protein Patl1_06690 [Pistacia atlantica]